jgi:hypothetical protein
MGPKRKLRSSSADASFDRISSSVFKGGRECPAAGDLKNGSAPREGTNEK